MRSTLLTKETDLKLYFTKKIKLHNYRKETTAYIINIFSEPITDLSDQSITIYYANAIEHYRFDMFQCIGDWLLFTKTIFPDSLNNASPQYYDSVAQRSYYICYKMLNKKWLLYEELADRFSNITNTLRNTIYH